MVFDTETTGLHARKGDRIVSISAVRLREGRIDLSDTFHELINPNRDIPSETAIIHGILAQNGGRKTDPRRDFAKLYGVYRLLHPGRLTMPGLT